MKKSLIILIMVMVFGSTVSVHALLIDRGGGLIYDDVLDITWLQDASYAQTSGYDADGWMAWSNAVTWAENLSYYDSVRDYTYTDWRLPHALPVNGVSYDFTYSNDGSTDVGINISSPNSELGYMYYTELGNSAGSPSAPNAGPFINLQSNWYWASPEGLDPGTGVIFAFHDGRQLFNDALIPEYAWAVRDGDVVPEPATLLLLGLGGLALRRKRRA
ncbi:MAG TPA: DUF1566 domain-containing protein [Phycisphaerales bacterium]|nr:DUF1566 domain-containing protein [Phycisphaerales bacterium]